MQFPPKVSCLLDKTGLSIVLKLVLFREKTNKMPLKSTSLTIMMLLNLPFDEIPGEKAVQDTHYFSYCIFSGFNSKHELWLTWLKTTAKQHSVQ